MFFLLRPGFGAGGSAKGASNDDADLWMEPVLDREMLPCLPGGGCLAEWACCLTGWPPFWPGAGVLSRWRDPSAGLFLACDHERK